MERLIYAATVVRQRFWAWVARIGTAKAEALNRAAERMLQPGGRADCRPCLRNPKEKK